MTKDQKVSAMADVSAFILRYRNSSRMIAKGPEYHLRIGFAKEKTARCAFKRTTWQFVNYTLSESGENTEGGTGIFDLSLVAFAFKIVSDTAVAEIDIPFSIF